MLFLQIRVRLGTNPADVLHFHHGAIFREDREQAAGGTDGGLLSPGGDPQQPPSGTPDASG